MHQKLETLQLFPSFHALSAFRWCNWFRTLRFSTQCVLNQHNFLRISLMLASSQHTNECSRFHALVNELLILLHYFLIASFMQSQRNTQKQRPKRNAKENYISLEIPLVRSPYFVTLHILGRAKSCSVKAVLLCVVGSLWRGCSLFDWTNTLQSQIHLNEGKKQTNNQPTLVWMPWCENAQIQFCIRIVVKWSVTMRDIATWKCDLFRRRERF